MLIVTYWVKAYILKKYTEASLVASSEILEVMLRKLNVHASKIECRTQ